MKERVGDEKLIISVAVRGINDHTRFYSQIIIRAGRTRAREPVARVSVSTDTSVRPGSVETLRVHIAK